MSTQQEKHGDELIFNGLRLTVNAFALVLVVLELSPKREKFSN